MPPPRRHVVVPHRQLLGRTVDLRVDRMAAAGAWLVDDASPDASDGAPSGASDAAADAIFLPKREVPDGTAVGDTIPVFVALDSEDRPLATTRRPHLQLGEVAFLRVSAATAIGVFVDWGLPKELLVPFREQTRDLAVGERHPVGLRLDKSGRLVGTMRVSELLRSQPVVGAGEWVTGAAWRTDPAVGLFVIVERRFVGLVPKSEPQGLARGESALFRVTRVRPDGKFELSLRAEAHRELADDAAHVLAILQLPTTPKVGDHTSPDDIRTHFGLSKKAFKRALGRLLKDSAITLDAKGAAGVARTPPIRRSQRPR
jgi:predicted RNA-binding protein (virulence factor B family)